MKVLAMVLLAVRDDRFRLAELVEHDDELATLDLLHLAGEQVADAARELVANLRPLAFTDALNDPLLGGQHSHSSEFVEIDGRFENIADLKLLVVVPRFLEGNLARRIGGVPCIANRPTGPRPLPGGALLLETETHLVRQAPPVVYQETRAGEPRRIVAGRYAASGNDVHFVLGPYDRTKALVIDPVLSYSTYLGGSGAESSVSVAVGADNNIYLAGSTMSSNFPVTTTPPAYQGTLAGTQNIFIAVINPSMQSAQQLVYATYIGGSGIDTAAGVAVSSHIDQTTSGYDVYVAGSTTSPDFPTSRL